MVLYDELINMGYSKPKAEAKIALCKLDDQIDSICKKHDLILSHANSFEEVKSELDELEVQHSRLCNMREEQYNIFCN